MVGLNRYKWLKNMLQQRHAALLKVHPPKYQVTFPTPNKNKLGAFVQKTTENPETTVLTGGQSLPSSPHRPAQRTPGSLGTTRSGVVPGHAPLLRHQRTNGPLLCIRGSSRGDSQRKESLSRKWLSLPLSVDSCLSGKRGKPSQTKSTSKATRSQDKQC